MPTTRSATIIMVANTGRLMETSLSSMGPRTKTVRQEATTDYARGYEPRPPRPGFAPAAHTVDDLGYPAPVVGDSEMNRGNTDGTALDSIDEGSVSRLRLANRLQRDRADTGQRPMDDSPSRERSTLEGAGRVGDFHIHGGRPCHRIDRRSDARNVTGELAAISDKTDELVHAHGTGHSRGNGRRQFQHVVPNNGVETRTPSHVLSALDFPF